MSEEDRALRARIEELSAELKQCRSSLEGPVDLSPVVEQRLALSSLSARREELRKKHRAVAERLELQLRSVKVSKQSLEAARHRIAVIQGTDGLTLKKAGTWSWNRLASWLGASLELFLEVPAMLGFAVVVATVRRPTNPTDWSDVAATAIVGVLAAVCAFVLIRRIVRPRERKVELRLGDVEVPSISLWHFLYDGAFLALAVALRSPEVISVFVPVPLTLVVLRALWWTRRHRLD